MDTYDIFSRNTATQYWSIVISFIKKGNLYEMNFPTIEMKEISVTDEMVLCGNGKGWGRMDFYEVIEKRRTVRDFESEEIPEEVIERVVSAAMKAPTNDHMRDWHYIVVTDKAVAEKLVKAVPKEITDTDLKKLIRDWNLDDSIQQECYRNAVPRQYRMLFDASAIIVPLLKQKTDILHPGNISHLNGFASIWCSIENLLQIKVDLKERIHWNQF